MTVNHLQTFVTSDGLLSVATQRAPDRRAADRIAFATDHWPELAAAAWEGFQRHGAGAVVLWRQASPSRWRRAAFTPERLWYTTQVHVLPGISREAFDGWEAAQIEAYDPRTEAVVVFVEGNRLFGVRLTGSPSPPDARARAGTSLN